jgi:hypothetical protein
MNRTLQHENRFVSVGPMARLVAKLVGSGPNRLKMVKLSHELHASRGDGRSR